MKGDQKQQQQVNGKKTRGPCTWEELSNHSTLEDCWVAVDGKVYDITRYSVTLNL